MVACFIFLILYLSQVEQGESRLLRMNMNCVLKITGNALISLNNQIHFFIVRPWFFC